MANGILFLPISLYYRTDRPIDGPVTFQPRSEHLLLIYLTLGLLFTRRQFSRVSDLTLFTRLHIRLGFYYDTFEILNQYIGSVHYFQSACFARLARVGFLKSR